jgi:hypothetical protein
MWAITGWPIAAAIGRRTTVTQHYPAAWVQDHNAHQVKQVPALSPVQQQYGQPDPAHWYWDQYTRSHQPR